MATTDELVQQVISELKQNGTDIKDLPNAEKANEIQDIIGLDSGDNLKKISKEKLILEHIQGTSEDSDASADPFKRYPDSFSDPNNEGFLEALNKMHSYDDKDGWEGNWRVYIGKQGVEVRNVAKYYKDDLWLQIVKGPYGFKNGKFAFGDELKYHILYRTFNGSVWSDFKEYNEDLETKAVNVNDITITQDADSVNIVAKSVNNKNSFQQNIPAATENFAGVMSAEDKVNLVNSTVTKVNWNSSSNLNDFINTGTYDIKGTRQNAADNLPITNTGTNATIAARLIVTVTPEGTTTYRHSIGQTLILSNAEGKETKIYTRNGNRTSYDGGVSYTVEWGVWATQQTNTNVGQVDNLDSLTDNGIYSGVWSKGSYSAYPLTFVCVVINDYFIGVSLRRISQFVYGLSKFDGSTIYQSRVWDDSKNAWGDWEILNKEEISLMISNEIKKVTDGADPEKLDSLKELIAWVDTHGGEVAGIKNDIQANEAAIEMETERAIEAEEKLKENIAKEKNALINGDIIVGVAREVYSRQGKTDTATFLKRTTAGGTSISDGIASIKHIGGNIIKNLVDYNNVTKDKKINLTEHTNIYKVEVTAELGLGSCNIIFNTNVLTLSHKYYIGFSILSEKKVSTFFTKSYGGITVFSNLSVDGWNYISNVVTVNELSKDVLSIFPFSYNGTAEAGWTAYFSRPTVIDLTEMYGDGNEPTKEECDKMFATIGTLPQGITVAQPTGFKSIGFNQWNPANKIEGKGIINNVITDAETDIAFMECLPCKAGTGENNGYIIGYGEGDSWNDTGVEVYFSPNSVFDTDGAYIQKLTKDATYNTYVPRAAGYLFIVTPTTEKLCAHLHWSGDREVTDYEEYVESNVTLPTIPQMSEWGLAGIQQRRTPVCDEIDFERGVYIKRIGSVDLGSLNWVWNEQYQLYRFDARTPIPNIAPHCSGLCREYPFVGDYANAVDNSIGTIFTNYIFVKDSKYTDAESLKASLQGVILYYEFATPVEYPIVTKAAPNYIGSDYGVEQFTGSKVPLTANILFYMRSLVSETRNFLDRLMAGLGSDVTEVADKIIAAVKQHNVEPEESTEE